MTATPQLSIPIQTFAADDPGSFTFLLDRARAADAAGVDRNVCSDHVVYGENLEAYGDPKNGGSAGGKQPTEPTGGDKPFRIGAPSNVGNSSLMAAKDWAGGAVGAVRWGILGSHREKLTNDRPNVHRLTFSTYGRKMERDSHRRTLGA